MLLGEGRRRRVSGGGAPTSRPHARGGAARPVCAGGRPLRSAQRRLHTLRAHDEALTKTPSRLFPVNSARPSSARRTPRAGPDRCPRHLRDLCRLRPTSSCGHLACVSPLDEPCPETWGLGPGSQPCLWDSHSTRHPLHRRLLVPAGGAACCPWVPPRGPLTCLPQLSFLCRLPPPLSVRPSWLS